MIRFNKHFSKLCRCCMENGKLNVFTTMFEKLSIVNILEICISEKICLDDRLPNNICQQCYDKTISCYLFIINCKNVQIQLQDILKKETNSLEEKANLSDCEALDISLEIKYESSDEDYTFGKKPELKRINNSKMELSSNLYNKDELKLETSSSKRDIENSYDLNNASPSMIFKLETGAQKNFPVDCSHEERKGITCEQCQKEFSEKPFLIEHMKSHSDECTGSIEIDKNSAAEKLKTSVQKYMCIDCGTFFEFMKHLEQHCRNNGHSIPRRFSCKICFKNFLSNTRLNDHMRIHNNDRPYKCSECNMTFTSNSNLKRHKKKHTGEKSYFCEVCGRGFIQKHTLTVHMRLHNGETPYVCELCGKGYRTKPLLHQHMYKHKDTETQVIKYRKYYLKYGKMKVECEICKKNYYKECSIQSYENTTWRWIEEIFV